MEVLFVLFMLFFGYSFFRKGMDLGEKYRSRSELRRARSYIQKKSKVMNV